MDWYYVENNNRVGPVSEAAFRDLVGRGVIKGGTLVWCAEMQNWEPYRAVLSRFPMTSPSEQETIILTPGTSLPGGDQPVEGGTGTGSRVFCSDCGRLVERSSQVALGNGLVCPECRDARFRSPQGADSWAAPRFEYGGFWIRLLAKILDGFVLFLVMLVPLFLLSWVTGRPLMNFEGMAEQDPEMDMTVVMRELAYSLVQAFIQFVVAVFYDTFFVGKYGATPGKMACGLQVVRPDGTPVTYLRAFGRHFAEWLSQITLMIGYIIAAFDDEKRSLHDLICDTRVIRK